MCITCIYVFLIDSLEIEIYYCLFANDTMSTDIITNTFLEIRKLGYPISSNTYSSIIFQLVQLGKTTLETLTPEYIITNSIDILHATSWYNLDCISTLACSKGLLRADIEDNICKHCKQSVLTNTGINCTCVGVSIYEALGLFSCRDLLTLPSNILFPYKHVFEVHMI